MPKPLDTSLVVCYYHIVASDAHDARINARRVEMTEQIISGTYTVVSSKTGAHRTVAIMDDDFEWMTNYKPAQGTRVVKAMLGSDNERLTSIGTFSPTNELRIWGKHQQRVDFIAALKYVIAKGAEERVQMGKNYAVRSGKCYICNRKLTTPASVFYGYGPICAEREGLPYSASAGSPVVNEGASAPSTDENGHAFVVSPEGIRVSPTTRPYCSDCTNIGPTHAWTPQTTCAPKPTGDVLEQANAVIAEHVATRPACKLCHGNGGQLNEDGVHNLCAARSERGLNTPSLGDVCPTCGGSGVDPARGLKNGQAMYNPSGSSLKAAFPDCPQCQGTRVVNVAQAQNTSPNRVGFQRVSRPRSYEELFGAD